jgi:phage virion morphogenesis protein
MIKVGVNQGSLLSTREQINLLMLPANKRKRILQQLNRHLVKQNRRNMRENKDPSGKSWAKRKSGNKKVIRKLGKQMRSKADSNQATVFFPGVAGVIATQHHQGSTEKWTASKAKRVYGKPDFDAKPSRLQAKRLREQGYKKPGKGKKKPQAASLKWIIENMSSGQVGLITRLMKDKKSTTSWEIKLPERQLLGAKPKDVAEFLSMQLEKERR